MARRIFFNNNEYVKEKGFISVIELKDGKLLAEKYCQSCHALPDPSLLSKEMWVTGVLPRMGPFLGIKSHHGESYFRANDVGPDFFPPKPLLDSADWEKIVNYYTASAPETLPQQIKNVIEIKRELPFFSVIFPKSPFLYNTTSMTSYVRVDNSVKPNRILVADGMANKLIVLDQNLNILKSNILNGPLVDISFDPTGMFSTTIGTEAAANNARNGSISEIKISHDGNSTITKKPLFSNLARPVNLTQADLNGDGKRDYVISQYGNLIGELSWMENNGKGGYKSHTLRKTPGALKAIIKDANQDKLPDIWVQFAQGNEGIFLYINKGHGSFVEKQILQFPPTYGSTSFELIDFNNDGLDDIVYTCGDNGDYTQILKPYHGVYIFLNDGKHNFRQRYFYPINGCYKAISRDFDSDGDIDIATISFFPAAKTPWEAFVFLENKGNFNFQPYTLPENTSFQKGVTMDAGDLDRDGKIDIVLGNGYYTSNEKGEREPLLIVLKNITK